MRASFVVSFVAVLFLSGCQKHRPVIKEYTHLEMGTTHIWAYMRVCPGKVWTEASAIYAKEIVGQNSAFIFESGCIVENQGGVLTFNGKRIIPEPNNCMVVGDELHPDAYIRTFE